VIVGYPNEQEEFAIVHRMTGPTHSVQAVTDTDTLRRLQAQCRQGYVDPALMQYAVKLVLATRHPAQHGLPELARYITLGASPRATIQLVEGARALAFLRGRGYATPQDMRDLVPDVLRHRLVLSYEALSEGMTADAVITSLLQSITPPAQPLHNHVEVPASAQALG
jgi:MoxR-like ATPase